MTIYCHTIIIIFSYKISVLSKRLRVWTFCSKRIHDNIANKLIKIITNTCCSKYSFTHKIYCPLFSLLFLGSLPSFLLAADTTPVSKSFSSLFCLAHLSEGLVRDIHPKLTATTSVILKVCAWGCKPIVQHTTIILYGSMTSSIPENTFVVVCILWNGWWCGTGARMPHVQSFTLQVPVLKRSISISGHSVVRTEYNVVFLERVLPCYQLKKCYYNYWKFLCLFTARWYCKEQRMCDDFWVLINSLVCWLNFIISREILCFYEQKLQTLFASKSVRLWSHHELPGWLKNSFSHTKLT